MINKNLLSSKNQKWETPASLFGTLDNIFEFALDPCCEHETAKCALHFTPVENGLKQDWNLYGTAFVNPPFGPKIKDWVHKSYIESLGGIVVVMLIPARPDTKYWHQIIFKYARAICFIKGRIKFGREGQIGQKGGALGAPFPSAIVVFGDCESGKIEALKDLGKVFYNAF